jgi:Mn-dependent DtxR family transcriptional regulator
MNNSNNKKIYKRWAGIYDKFLGSKYINKQRELEISMLNLKKGDSVLFIGIGTGEDLKFLPRGVEVVGVDITDEMLNIARKKAGFTRVHDLSAALNVQPPSATKMVQKLAELKLLKYEKYGILKLEENGELLRKTLLKRHNVIEKFLKILGVSESEILTETEKIEHTITKKTTKCFENFIEFSNDNPEIIAKYKSYIDEQK